MSDLRWRANHYRNAGILFFLVFWGFLSVQGCRDASDGESGSLGVSTDPVSTWSPRSHEGFVGSQACQRCHETIYEKYQAHPMAHAMSTPDQLVNSIEHQSEGRVFSNPPFLEYEIEVAGDKILHHERVLDDEGEVLVEQTEPVAFAVGSGERGRSYLLERDGELFMSPLSWYASDKKWDLSPGFIPANHPQFSRPIADRCLRCHCGEPSGRTGGTVEFPAYEKPIVAEAGISCERCHGPGEEHIQFHDFGKGGSQSVDPIVNPIKLGAIERDDVCNQCHLQGKFEILRPGRQPDDFRPGDAISDIWTIFVEGTNVNEDQSTKAVSHVQQMQSSRCYIESERELACVSCHDPHGMAPPVERAMQVRQACLKCHQTDNCTESMSVRQETSITDNCAECHMPRLAANDVPHTTQTDHRIRKDPWARPEGLLESNIANAEMNYEAYEGETHPLAEAEFERALGIAVVRDATQKGDVNLYNVALERLLPLRDAFSNDVIFLEALGLAFYRSDQVEKAIDAWEQILNIDPNHTQSLLDLGSYFEREGQLGRAEEYLARYVRIKPHDIDGNFRLSLVKGQLLEMDTAIEYANKALELNPRNWEVRRWLATLYRDSGQGEKMQETQKLLDKINQNRLRKEASQ